MWLLNFNRRQENLLRRKDLLYLSKKIYELAKVPPFRKKGALRIWCLRYWVFISLILSMQKLCHLYCLLWQETLQHGWLDSVVGFWYTGALYRRKKCFGHNKICFYNCASTNRMGMDWFWITTDSCDCYCKCTYSCSVLETRCHTCFFFAVSGLYLLIWLWTKPFHLKSHTLRNIALYCSRQAPRFAAPASGWFYV